jgi:hypothetical protein
MREVTIETKGPWTGKPEHGPFGYVHNRQFPHVFQSKSSLAACSRVAMEITSFLEGVFYPTKLLVNKPLVRTSMYPVISPIFTGLGLSSPVAPVPALPTAAWDLVSFLENAGEYVKTGGGALLVAMGLVALVWGGVLLLKKLMGGQQNQDSWMKIIGLMIIGGAIAVGGFTLIFTIGSGGKTTIEDLGGGTLLLLGLG